MIKVLVCDGDGTLELPNPSSDIRDMLSLLPDLNIKLAVASNAGRASVITRFRKAGLKEPAYIVTPADVNGQKKASPVFIYKISDLTGAKLNEMVYLGDDDKTDTFCAINAKVLPFAAKYSKSGKPMDYGIPVEHPKALCQYLATYAKQDEPYFGWTYHGRCKDTNTSVEVHALFGEHRAMGLTDKLKAFLKDKQDIKVGKHKVPLGSIVFHYLVSQTYLSGLISDIDCIAVYPGHEVHSPNPLLEAFSSYIRLAFKQWFTPELLVRHIDAQESHKTQNRNIFEQFRTIRVNPTYADKIKGKNVLVLDDFTTTGYSLETARRMLLQAGAAKVVALAIAKYRSEYSLTHISRSWDAFNPCPFGENDIAILSRLGSLNSAADKYFQDNIWSVYNL